METYGIVGYGFNKEDFNYKMLDPEKIKNILINNTDIREIFAIDNERAEAIRATKTIKDIEMALDFTDDETYLYDIDYLIYTMLNNTSANFETECENSYGDIIYIPARMPWNSYLAGVLTSKENLDEEIKTELMKIYKDEYFGSIPHAEYINTVSKV